MRRLALCLTLILMFVVSGPAWPQGAIPAIPPEALEVLVRARSDLELLATDQIGRVRPQAWNASLDINDPQLAVLIRLDLELLAAYLLDVNTRPDGWFGATAGTPFSVARDIRHDLELLADTVIAANQRPTDWSGDDPLMRCNRSTQTLVLLLERSGIYSPLTDPRSPNYCGAVSVEINQFVEANYPNGLGVLPQAQTSSPVAAMTAPEAAADSSPISGDDVHFANDWTAIAFLDRYAMRRVGTIPAEEPFRVLARSYTQFSRMILVEGADFLVFVDYRSTTLPGSVFDDLPDINTGVYETTCEAGWCQPVVLLPGMDGAGSSGPGGRQPVSPSTNMIIYYDGSDSEGTTLVRMELCGQPGTNCEPVTEVIAPDGSTLAAVGSVGGISQFRLPYGYSTHSPRSRSYFTGDIWINFP